MYKTTITDKEWTELESQIYVLCEMLENVREKEIPSDSVSLITMMVLENVKSAINRFHKTCNEKYSKKDN